jgi:hypothetical protein
MTGSQLNPISITEYFPYQNGNLSPAGQTLNSQRGKPWSVANGSINSTNGQFTDSLNSGGLPGFARSGTAFQEFAATGSFGLQPLDIIFFNKSYSGVNYNTYTKDLVTVNGFSATGPCR